MSERKTGRPSARQKYITELRRLYLDEKWSLSEIHDALGPSVQTLSRWLQEEGVGLEPRPRNPNAGRTLAQQTAINERIRASLAVSERKKAHPGGRTRGEWEERSCANSSCENQFEAPVTSSRRFCSRVCARRVQGAEMSANVRDAWYESDESLCACGEARIPYENRHTWKYCSDACRRRFGEKRQADPANYITFTCLNPACGKEVTRLKKYSNYRKYCSNECAAKHTRKKEHIVVDDAVVLDSGYEALFWGLCSLWKIPVERADRGQAIPVNGNGWYCPDFYLPGPALYAEVKGFEDDDDRARCAAWRAAGHRLAVVGREQLDVLRVIAQDSQAVAYLEDLADKAVR